MSELSGEVAPGFEAVREAFARCPDVPPGTAASSEPVAEFPDAFRVAGPWLGVVPRVEKEAPPRR